MLQTLSCDPWFLIKGSPPLGVTFQILCVFNINISICDIFFQGSLNF